MAEKNRRVDDDNIASMRTTLEFMAPQLQAVHETLNGNGQPGLKIDVAVNKKSIKTQWYFIGSIFLSIALGAVGVVYACIKVMAIPG